MNSINLVGKLYLERTGKRITAKGDIFCEFGLVVKRKNSERRDFLVCRAHGQDAENIVLNFSSGDWAAVSGEYHVDKYGSPGHQNYHHHYIDVLTFEGKAENQKAARQKYRQAQEYKKRTETAPAVEKIKWI